MCGLGKKAWTWFLSITGFGMSKEEKSSDNSESESPNEDGVKAGDQPHAPELEGSADIDDVTGVDEVDTQRRKTAFLLMIIGAGSIFVLLYLVLWHLPALVRVDRIGELTQSEIYYSLGVLVAHGLLTGSVLAIGFKVLSVAERLLLPIEEADSLSHLLPGDSADSSNDPGREKARDRSVLRALISGLSGEEIKNLLASSKGPTQDQM